jgi:hypothetical protein
MKIPEVVVGACGGLLGVSILVVLVAHMLVGEVRSVWR